MTKTKRLSTILLGAILALGVGAGLGASRVETGRAASETINYVFSSATWEAEPADWTSGKGGLSYSSTQGVQVATGQNGANATSPTSYDNITSIVVEYSTNNKKGVGSIKVYSLPTATGTATQIGSEFSVTAPSSDGGTTLKDTTNFVPSKTSVNGYIKLEVKCSTNSVYINSITITYGTGGGGDPEFGTLDSIAIKTPAAKTSFEVGETFTSAGLVLTASDDSDPVITKDITTGFTTNFDGVTFNNSHLGTKAVQIAYEEGVNKVYANYNIEIHPVPTGKNVTLAYSGASTTNMVEGNNAESVGLDPSIFDVLSTERETNPIHIGLNNSGQIRLYGSKDSTGNGNILTVSINEAYFISSFKINFGGAVAPALIKGGDDILHDGDLTKDNSLEFKDRTDNEFSIKNIVLNNGTQIYILSIEIYYKKAISSADVAAVENFIANYMHPEIDSSVTGPIDGTAGECISKGYYAAAKAAFNALTADQRELFVSDYEAPRARLVAWAIANGDVLNASNTLEAVVNSLLQTPFIDLNDNSTIMIIVLISLIGVSVIGSSLFVFKRKQNKNY